MTNHSTTEGVTLHKAENRIFDDLGWLKIHASFRDNASSAHQRSFGALTILDDAVMIPGGRGFQLHPHDNIEVVSYIVSGTDRHTDNEYGIRKLRAGDVQLMSAGKGIQHADGNDSDSDPVYMFQIWVLPDKQNVEPNYQFTNLRDVDCKDKFYKFITPEGVGGSLKINQRAYFSITRLSEGAKIEYNVNISGNGIYLLVLSGEIRLDEMTLRDRDAAGFCKRSVLFISSVKNSELLLIEVPV